MDTSNPESILGKRIVNYLKNEALIGRIGKQKIQVKLPIVCLFIPQVRWNLILLCSGVFSGPEMCKVIIYYVCNVMLRLHFDMGEPFANFCGHAFSAS